MFTLAYNPFLLLSSLWIAVTHAGECINNSTKLRTRIFGDLPDMEMNKHPFSLEDPRSKGNDVMFNTSDIPVIPQNAFVTYDSRNIRKIALSGKSIVYIENNAFYELDSLVILDLSNNTLPQITKDIFKGLGVLLDLDLSSNTLQDLPDAVFSHLYCLRKLSLAYNNLRFLTQDSFFQLRQLQKLDLSNNYFKKITASALRYFASLINLQLGSNQIEDLDIVSWTATNNLQVLNVSDNALVSFDMSIKYSFSNALIELYLDNNYLTNLFVSDLNQRFASLRLMSIHNNFWNCSDLFLIVQKLTILQVNHYGNEETQPNIHNIGCNRSNIIRTTRFWRPEDIPHIALSLTNKTDKEEELKKAKEKVAACERVLFVILLAIVVGVVVRLVIALECYERCRVIFSALRRPHTNPEVTPLSPRSQLFVWYGSPRSRLPRGRRPYTEVAATSSPQTREEIVSYETVV